MSVISLFHNTEITPFGCAISLESQAVRNQKGIPNKGRVLHGNRFGGLINILRTYEAEAEAGAGAGAGAGAEGGGGGKRRRR